MNYRSDIDGLRAIAVLSVIMFHVGIGALSGGYIGVDIFFVISGYLITTVIYKEISAGTFTFSQFYKRRAARLLPALAITLFVVLIFGFVFYNNKAFDNLGKEFFFSAIGGANILFAQGLNYFTKDEAYQPLIHLWSLGVEEQFYLIWPILLLLTFRFSKGHIFSIALLALFVSLGMSIYAVEARLTKGYFLLQYRAFELLIGVIISLLMLRSFEARFNEQTKQIVSYVGLGLILAPMFVLDANSRFPGLNALWPCVGTALIIVFPNQGFVTKLLSHRALVFLGLISYPLYLFHQPVISFMHFFDVQTPFAVTFLLVITISVLAAWVTYKYVEIPIRKTIRSGHRKRSLVSIAALSATVPCFAIAGLVIAKSGGLEERFQYLNPFALEISNAHTTGFDKHLQRGFNVSPAVHGKVLFVGDSVLQDYIWPMHLALGLEKSEIDTVTRGGCVLLKNADFVDEFSDISCNDMRSELYTSKKTYDLVVISQNWNFYDGAVLNFAEGAVGVAKWENLIDATVAHFIALADKIAIIAAHPVVDGTLSLQPSVMMSEDAFTSNLSNLEILNIDDLELSRTYFDRYRANERIVLIEPQKIFCLNSCQLTDGKWSYFRDAQHLSGAASNFVQARMSMQLQGQGVTGEAVTVQ